MMSFWVMLDDSINTDELLAGAGAAALAAFFAELVTYQAATRFRMPIEWLVPAFSLPGQVVRDMVIVYHALIPQFGGVVEAAIRFEDQTGYITTVLAGAHVAHPVVPAAAESAGITLSDVLTGTGTAIGALILAFLALYWRRLPLLRHGYEPGAGLTAPIQRFQSGVINDYVAWMVLGLAVIGGVPALIIR
jgi:hypothetical protein